MDVAGVSEADIPGHPTRSELLARLATLADELVSSDTVVADAQTLLDTGLFADVSVEVVQPRFYGLSPPSLQPVGRAHALRFVTTPRQLAAQFDGYAVGIDPELGGYDAAYAAIAPHVDPKPTVPWLPAFNAAFEALDESDAHVSPLHLCCLVRHAVCVAGSEHVPPAKPVALHFEQDEEAAPGALIVGMDVPDDAALTRMRRLPADAKPYDVWWAATEDAFAADTDRGVANDARHALTVPPPAPAARRRPHATRRRAAQFAALDAVMGQMGMLPFELLSAVAAWRLRVTPGDDMRSAIASAVRCDARCIVLVDRPVRATVRRAGTAFRRFLVAFCIPVAVLVVALLCILTSMPAIRHALAHGLAALGLLAVALMFAALAALAVAPTSLVARFMTPPRETPAHAPAALISERDACMVSHLACLATTGRTLAHATQLVRTAHGSGVVYVLSRGTSEEDGDEKGPTVAVVGAAHLPGILARWQAGGMTAVDG